MKSILIILALTLGSCGVAVDDHSPCELDGTGGETSQGIGGEGGSCVKALTFELEPGECKTLDGEPVCNTSEEANTIEAWGCHVE